MEVTQIDFTDVWIEQFHFVRKLGEGGFAAVWLAEQCNLHRMVERKVAIKVFLDDRKDPDSFKKTVENFQRDSGYLAGLTSTPPIVSYFYSDYCDLAIGSDRVPTTMSSRVGTKGEEGRVLTAFYIVMEYADGGSLGNNYRREVILKRPGKKWIDHFLDVCTALKAAHGHSRSIVHRDIKPHNLLWFKERDQVKVADFGTAKDLSEVDLASEYILGSLPYMSPESFKGQNSPERDIYALGCTFYELLTGRQAIEPSPARYSGPPNRNTVECYREAHETNTRPDAALLVPQLVSMDFSHVLKEMMLQNPNERPTLDEVMKALEKERPKLPPAGLQPKPAPLPHGPQYRSRYDINPGFRLHKVPERVYFLSFRTIIRGDYRLIQLLSLLQSWFDESFSLYELFGRRDFMIRIWADNESRVQDFCATVIKQILDDQKRDLLVMMCNEASYLGAKEALHHPGEVREALITLHDAQKHHSKEAERKLTRWGVYSRPSAPSAKGSRIRCFTLVTNEAGSAESDRVAKFLLIKKAIESSQLKLPEWNFSLYSKAYTPLNGFEPEPNDYLLSYSAPSFSDIVTVPSLILNAFEHRVTTDTLLATKRFYIESDQFYFSEAQGDNR